jgi:Co/Zn/Cd efflux system component
MNFSEVQDMFLSVDGIVGIHNLRIWGLTTDKTALSAHLAVSKFILRILRRTLFIICGISD